MNQLVVNRSLSLRTLLPLALLLAACSGDEGATEAPLEFGGSGQGATSGSGGQAGAGGAKAGAGGVAGKGGSSAGAAGAGAAGAAGKGGASAGQAGAAGSGGAAGAGQGGAAGKGGAAGAGGKIACETTNDCAGFVPETKPAGCAKAICDEAQKFCRFVAKDLDGDGDPSNSCKSQDPTINIELGGDCDETDDKVNSKAWDGPEGLFGGKAQPNRCDDGVDNDCNGTIDDSKLDNNESCKCVPGDVRKCSEDSSGKPIPWPGGMPQGKCKFGNQTCESSGKWAPCTNAVPPSEEICDKLDNDCDGLTDEDDALNKKTWRWDADADLHGDDSFQPVVACDPPTTAPVGCVDLVGKTSCTVGSESWKTGILNDDCDDTDASTNPEAKEACDGKDNNCSGTADENVVFSDYYWDNDHDGVPGTTLKANACAALDCPVGGDCANGQWLPFNLNQIPSAMDNCDDDANRTPGKPDVCGDGIDNDCNGVVDDGMIEFCSDVDGDGVCGSCGQLLCPGVYPGKRPRGDCYKQGNVQDCDDGDGTRAQSKSEVCDGVDNNCDLQNNEGFFWNGLSVGAGCSVGTGACAASGSVVCTTPGSVGCSATSGQSQSFKTSPAPNGSWDWNCDGADEHQYGIDNTPNICLTQCTNLPLGVCNGTHYLACSGPGECGGTLWVLKCAVVNGIACQGTLDPEIKQGCR
jgi:hypothetical protein